MELRVTHMSHRKHILVADPDAAFAAAVIHYFKANGWEVRRRIVPPAATISAGCMW